MRDVELYRSLLGLTAPWTVADVEVDMKGQRVVVRVDAEPGPYPCPECGTAGPRYDSQPRRRRHLDMMQFTERRQQFSWDLRPRPTPRRGRLQSEGNKNDPPVVATLPLGPGTL